MSNPTIPKAFEPADDSPPEGDFQITCRDCGAVFLWHRPADSHPALAKLFPTICKVCSEKYEGDQPVDTERDRLAAWRSVTPALYQETDPDRLPLNDGVRRVLDWQYGARGIVAFGPSRTGKTRSVFLLLKRLYGHGRRAATFSALGFGHACSEAFSGKRGPFWVRSLSKVDILLLDDLGKDRLTDRVEAELFGLIESRIANCLPTIITTNLTGDTMAGTDKRRGIMSRDRAGPLLQRLREADFFESIAFIGKDGET